MRHRRRSRVFPALVEAGLFLTLACALWFRGALAPLYFQPVAALIFLLAAVWLIAANHGLDEKPGKTSMELPLAVFAGWLFVASLFSGNFQASLLELEKLLVMVLFFYMIFRHYRSALKLRWLCYGMYLLGLVSAIYGLVSYFGELPDPQPFLGKPRNFRSVTGTLVNHNNFAALMNLTFFLGLGLVNSVRPRRGEPVTEHFFRMLLVSLPIPVIIAALIFSLSRGGWISFMFGICVWVAWSLAPSFRMRPKKRNLKLTAIVGINLFFIILIFAYLERDALIQRLQTLDALFTAEQEISLKGRALVWKSSLEMIRDHPFTGTGPGTFHDVYPLYRQKGEKHGVVFAHNDFLQTASENGLFGLALFLWVLISLAVRALRIHTRNRDGFLKNVQKGIIVAMMAFLAHDLLEFHLHIPALAFFFIAFAAILLRDDTE